MRRVITLRRAAMAVSALSVLALGGAGIQVLESAAHAATTPADAPAAGHVVAMRRLSESQYRNTIADIFGPDIRVSGRFEPVVRPVHDLIASGARDASISPSGLEQFDAMARGVAAQVFAEHNRPQFMTCAPHDAAAADDACARTVLGPLGRYLFRRPLTASELAFYVGLANKGAQPTHSFDKGLQLALSAMLISPDFLYIVETAEADPAHPGQFRLDNYSRAARLSFVLWNTTPNEELLTAADQGRLTRQDQLEAIAGHMVKSPRFEQGVRAFFADMLLFERFDNLAKDPLIYPYFNTEVAQAMPEQMLRTIVDDLVTHDGDYRQLFTSSHTVMNRALGALYQTPVSRDKGWASYDFAPGDDRAGLLGQAGFLAIYSQSGRSSATLRGRAIRELLLCEPVPNPPGNVNFTAVQDVHNKATPTARDRLSAHATDPECSSCHKLMDPVGLSLERFDGIGAFRSTENNVAIDPSGTIDGKSFVGAAGLGQRLAADPATTECVAGRAMQYAMAQSSDSISGRQIDAVEKRFAADHYTIRSLFLQVATMPEAYAVPGARTAGVPTKMSLASTQR